MSKGLRYVLAVPAVLLLFGLFNWDSSLPALNWVSAPEAVGRETRIVLRVSDQGKGLARLQVTLARGESEQVLVSESYPGGWPWQERVFEREIALSPSISFDKGFLKEGPFLLRVSARDHSNFWLWSRSTDQERSFLLDLTPPDIEPLTARHYVRHGGAEAVVYRLSRDAVESGVQVGESRFRGYRLTEQGDRYICIFGLSPQASITGRMVLWARDGAGNEGETSFWNRVMPVNFRTRRVNLTDAFLEKVVPEIVSRSPRVEQMETPLDTYLKINGDLRRANNLEIAELRHRSRDRALWSRPFLQLSGSQVQSAFADRRRYFYKGQQVDEQMHLGFDLASVARSPVECANDGVVVHTGYLGIYGNCVIVDHGLGVMSLYGHQSSIDVEVGEEVSRGQVLGRTGETGLAGGDHLHFSLIVQGVQVNPLEWWDERWMEEHITSRLNWQPPE